MNTYMPSCIHVLLPDTVLRFHLQLSSDLCQSYTLVSDVDRVERFRLTLRFFDDVSTAS